MKLNQSVPAVLAMMIGSTLTSACSKSTPAAAQDNSAPTPVAAAPTATPVPVAAAAPAPAETGDPAPDQTATAAPPLPPAETPGPAPNPNTVWATGSWQLEQGRFVWMKGHWEPRREGQFEQARWVQLNGRWEHHPAHWIVARPEAPRPGELRPGERPGELRPGERPMERPIERR